MIYTFIRRDGSAYNSALASDLSARQVASVTTDIEQVETVDGRVVWRRVPDAELSPDREARRRKYRPDLYP